MRPRACSPYGQHLLLSDFLNQKSHKLQGAHSFSLKGGYLCVMAWVQWLMPYSSDFLLYSAMNNYMFAHSLEYCKSAKRLFFFISGPYHIRLSTVIKTYINDQADKWHKHSRNNYSSRRKWRCGVQSAKISWGWNCLPGYHRTNEWRGNDKLLSPQSCSLANLCRSPSCNERCAICGL